MSRFASKILTVGILLIACAALCSASTITEACSSVGPLPTELNVLLSCPQFNGGGTLTSMSIALMGSITGSITLTNNDSSSSQTGSGTSASAFSLGPLAGFIIVNPLFTASYTTGAQTLGPSQTKTFSGLTGSGSTTVNNTTTFLPYIGSSTFSVGPVTTLSSLTISGGGGNFGGSQITTASVSAEVTYNYASSTVPEPATSMLAGGALILFGLSFRQLSRRRQTR